VRRRGEGVDVRGLAEQVPAPGRAHLRARGAPRAVAQVGVVHVIDQAQVIPGLGQGHAEVPPLEERSARADGSVVPRMWHAASCFFGPAISPRVVGRCGPRGPRGGWPAELAPRWTSCVAAEGPGRESGW